MPLPTLDLLKQQFSLNGSNAVTHKRYAEKLSETISAMRLNGMMGEQIATLLTFHAKLSYLIIDNLIDIDVYDMLHSEVEAALCNHQGAEYIDLSYYSLWFLMTTTGLPQNQLKYIDNYLELLLKPSCKLDERRDSLAQFILFLDMRKHLYLIEHVIARLRSEKIKQSDSSIDRLLSPELFNYILEILDSATLDKREDKIAIAMMNLQKISPTKYSALSDVIIPCYEATEPFRLKTFLDLMKYQDPDINAYVLNYCIEHANLHGLDSLSNSDKNLKDSIRQCAKTGATSEQIIAIVFYEYLVQAKNEHYHEEINDQYRKNLSVLLTNLAFNSLEDMLSMRPDNTYLCRGEIIQPNVIVNNLMPDIKKAFIEYYQQRQKDILVEWVMIGNINNASALTFKRNHIQAIIDDATCVNGWEFDDDSESSQESQSHERPELRPEEYSGTTSEDDSPSDMPHDPEDSESSDHDTDASVDADLRAYRKSI